MDIVFTELTLNYLTVTLLAAALSAFALFDLRKGPLQPLRISFAGMSCSMFMLAVSLMGDSLFYQKWSYWFLISQTVFLVPIAGFFLIFAYHFPRKLATRSRELPFCILLASLIEVREIYIFFHRAWVAHQDVTIYWRSHVSDVFISLLFCWGVIVLLRQSARPAEGEESAGAIRRLIKPVSHSERRARNMGVVFLLPTLFTTQPTDYPLMSWVVLVVLSLFVLLYLNESPEKTSFMVKLTGVFLCFNLLVLSVCGGLLIMNARRASLEPDQQAYSVHTSKQWLVQENQSVVFTPLQGQPGYQLAKTSFDWHASEGEPVFPHDEEEGGQKRVILPFLFPYFGHSFQEAFVALDGYLSFDKVVNFKVFRYAYGNAPLIIPALMDVGERDMQPGGGVFVDRSTDQVVITWLEIPSDRRPELKHSFQLVLFPDGRVRMNYRNLDSLNALYYDAHYPVDIQMAGLVSDGIRARPERLHQRRWNLEDRLLVGVEGLVEDNTLMLLQAGWFHGRTFTWTLLAVFFLSLIGLPLFFYHTLIRPLQSLVAGVDTVNRGKFDVQVPVVFMDEIGFLTKSFNRMVQYVSQSTQLLHSYRTQLEDKVKERTKALEAAKAEAERANDAKAAFLANMSHELRTPLHPIIGFSRLVAEGNNLNDEQLESLNIIHTSGNHLLNLISDILIVSKAEAGKDRIVESEFNLVELLDDLRGILSMQIKERNMPLEWHIPTDMPLRYRSDANKIKQILLNLVGNALKFTSHGKVEVSVQWSDEPRQISCSHMDRKIHLRFMVSDTGEGIAQEDQKDLFKPFFQSPHSNRRHKGTGLGLSICKHFADILGGSIRIESELTVGTTVYFDVTLNAVGEEKMEFKQSGSQDLVTLDAVDLEPASVRILVAEDDPINAKLIRSMLAPAGFQLKIVSDGLQAYETAKDWKPHLIWMDIRMPVMDGRDATRAIRQFVEDEKIVPKPLIIALTADVNQIEKEEKMLSGFDRVMVKPSSKQDLMNAIHELVPQAGDGSIFCT
jgi:signal transduction histidine kinase/CheY-like chemotaxis protein